MSTTDTRAPVTGHGGGCGCGTCTGLSTFTRPRFFAGQLLTETELTALSAYTRGKDRLHNRYLHGAGVVCGLAVECDGCGPGVVLQPGYALDGLGNDVVVPDAVSIDVLALIDACTQSRRVQDCDPPRHPTATGCEEDEQSWCLWVRYAEQSGRLVTPLGGPARPSCGCSGSRSTGPASCGCGSGAARTTTRTATTGGSGGCGCGGSRSVGVSAVGSARATTSSAAGCGCGGGASSSASSTGRSSTDCEPSRVSELFDVGVAQLDCSCDESLGDRLSGTFPAKVLECIRSITPLLSRGMSKRMQGGALSLVTGGTIGQADGSAREAICTLYGNVTEVYRRDPLRTQCVLPEELSSIDCSPQGPNETDAHFQQRLQAAALALVQLVLLYLRDCLCAKLLPPCPDDCDDRVMLACVTVRDRKVVRICNLACRRYAGSFVSREYWLPIGPVLSWLAALVCCFPLPTRRLVRMPDGDRTRVRSARAAGGATRAAGAGQLDGVIAALTGDDFALASLWRRRAGATLARLRPATLLRSLSTTLEQDRDSISLAPLLHTDIADAAATLRKKGVAVELVEVADRSEALGLDLVPRAGKGETATLYTLGGVVVGVSGARETIRLRDLVRPPRARAEDAPPARTPAARKPAARKPASKPAARKPATRRRNQGGEDG